MQNIMDTTSVLKRLNINLTEFNHLRDKGIIQETQTNEYEQSHIESLYDTHRQTIKRRYFAYITDINPDYLNDLHTPNSVYVATILKLQATVSQAKDTISLRLKHTPHNLKLATLIIKDLGSTNTDPLPTTTNGKHKYIHLKFFSPSFALSLNNLNLHTIQTVFHRHMLRAIVELKFKVNKKNKVYSLQSTFQTRTIPNLVMQVVYSQPNTHQINELHARTTKNQTIIRFKLHPTDNTLIDYLYPKIHPDDQTPYFHNQQMGEAITYFDSEY